MFSFRFACVPGVVVNVLGFSPVCAFSCFRSTLLHGNAFYFFLSVIPNVLPAQTIFYFWKPFGMGCVRAGHYLCGGWIWRSVGKQVILRLMGQWSCPSFKVAQYSFLEWIPPTFERKLRRHKQRFGQINTTVVLDKDENLLWSGLQWHRSCHSNEMTPLPILLAAVFLGTGNCSSKIVYWSFFLQ